MTIAEVRGKISHTGQNLSERLEDLLTSDVFSACRYVRPNILLVPFLRQARGLNDQILGSFLNEQVKGTQYRFWPRLRLSEPDVLIAIESVSGGFFLVLIEAKYFSPKSSSVLGEEELEVAETPHDQLAREYTDLLGAHDAFGIPASKVTGKALVYVTLHRSFPRNSLEESLVEIVRFNPGAESINLFWTNWFELHPLVAQAKDTQELESVVLDDLRLLLERKCLLHFRGFKLNTIEGISEGTVYYRETEERPSYYEFAITQETVWPIPVFYSSRTTLHKYHFDVPTAQLPCKIYEGGGA
jgi:hypothetical protein